MMCRWSIAAGLLLAVTGVADVRIINTTNDITAYTEPKLTFEMPAGDSLRLNIQAVAGSSNLNFLAGGGHTFAWQLFNRADATKFESQSGANADAPVIDPALGQVRIVTDVVPDAGDYEIYVEAVPNGAANEAYPIAWHYVTVMTSAPSTSATISGGVTINYYDGMHITNGVVLTNFADYSDGTLYVNTNELPCNNIETETTTNDLGYFAFTNCTLYLGTNVGSVGGSGGLTYWTESFNTNNGIVGTEYYTTNDATMGFRIGTNFSLTIGNITNTLTGLLSIDIQASRLAGDYAAGAEQVVIGNQNDAAAAASYANIIGRGNSLNSSGVQIVGEGNTHSGSGADTVIVGNDNTSSGAARNFHGGKQMFSTGDDSITIGYLAYNQKDNGGAIGRSVNNTNYEAMVISMEDSATWKASQADGSITLSFSGGLYVTATNTIMWRMSPSGVLYFQTNELDFVNHTLNGTSLL